MLFADRLSRSYSQQRLYLLPAAELERLAGLLRLRGLRNIHSCGGRERVFSKPLVDISSGRQKLLALDEMRILDRMKKCKIYQNFDFS